MTSPESVGQVSVELIVEAKALAKQLRKEVESAFKDLDLSKLIQDSVGKTTVKLPVEPDFDTDSIPEKVKRTRVPKVPVELDPVVAAFQAEVKRQTAALARQVHVDVPIGADAGGLRAELGSQLAAVQAQAKIRVPTEPGAKAEYETKLKADLAEVAARVKQTVHVDVDVDKGCGGIGNILSGIGDLGKALPGLGRLSSGLADIGGSIQKLTGSTAQLGGNLAGAFQAAAGPVGALIGTLLGVAGAAAAGFGAIAVGVGVAIPAVTALAGALASLPGLLAGIGAGIGTLALGFKGISEAFKPKAGGGGGGAGNSAAQQARQIAAASRQVEAARRGITAANRGLAAAERNVLEAELAVGKAQDRARLAQEAVNRARHEALEDISDLNRELRGAQLGEEEAALAVTDALRELNQVKLTGNIPDIERARLAYERAQLSLEEATDTAQDLGEESDDANKKGVEGSDKVQDALRDQVEAWDAVAKSQQGVVDAQNGVLAAQDSLKSAYDGLASAQDSLASAQTKVASGAGGVAKEVTKLAPAAQKFVDAIKAMKPAFESLRLDVQQRLFAGLDKTITMVGNAWQKPLGRILGSYADTFNGFFKRLGSSISTPKFISDMEAGAEGFRKLLDKVGVSITDKLIPAFGALSKASAPFMEALGDELAKVVTSFSDWVLEGEKTGGLETFFDKATQAMHDIFDIGGVVFDIIGSIFEIITGSSPSSGAKNPLETFKNGLQKVADYLDNPANQQKIIGFINSVQTALDKVLSAGKQLEGMFSTLRGVFSSNGQGLGADLVAGIVTGMALSVAIQTEVMQQIGMSLIAGILGGVGLATEALGKFFSGLWQWVIDSTKHSFGIASPSTVFAEIGRNLILGLINGVGAMFSALSTRAAGIRTTVTNALANAGTLLVNAGRNTVSGLMNGITSSFRNLGIIAGNARVYVQNALSNAGSWLSQHGRAVVIGLANGIINQIPGLGRVLSWVTQFIRDHKGPIEKDRVLLKPAGQAIMSGLIAGISGEKNALAAELADVTSTLTVPELGTAGFGADLDASISRSLSVADRTSIQVGWKTSSTGDQFLDALAGLIDIRHNGDVQAALSRT